MVQLYKRKGGEVIVNTQTVNSQQGGNIALLAGGGFVVTWTDGSFLGGDASNFGVKAQLFDAAGNKVGSEFLVNTTTTGNQTGPAVAGLPSGRFVITWTDASATGGDTNSNAVRGQLFEANGTPVGSEFLVNTATTGSQSVPAISELSGGGFVISWTDASGVGGDNSGSGIKAQIFDANGAMVGSEILVNTEITGSQSGPSVIALGTGFAVAWQGATTAPGGMVSGSVRLQLFDSAGTKVGSEQVVNASNDGNFNSINITALGTGFIVTWAQQDYVFPGIVTVFNVHGQLFDANGAKVGGDFIVNTTTAGSQSTADVDPLPGGGFLVTWQGPGAGTSSLNIFGQVFDNAGAKVGPEFLIAQGNGSQTGARIDVLPSGDIVVLWTDTLADASSNSVVMQILTPTTDAPTDIALSGTVIAETAREGEGLLILSSTGAINSSFTYEIVSDSTGGAFGVQGDRLVVVDNSLLDFESDQQVEVRIRTMDLNGHSYEETLQVDISDTPETGYAAATDEFLVNTTTADHQVEPTLVALANGGFLATWLVAPLGGSSATGTRGQLFDANGAKVGGEFTLNDVDSIVALPGGGFVAAGPGSDGSGSGIFVTFYDSAGVATAAPIPVNTTTVNEQSGASLALLPSGNFIVTWTDFTMSTFLSVVRAQFLDPAGNKVGTEFTVPFLVPSGGGAEVAVLDNGNFVVSWGGAWNAQIFTAAGVRYGPEIVLDESNLVEPHLVALAGGGFVVTYARNISGGGFTGIDRLTAEIFDAEGRRIGSPVLIAEDGPSLVNSTAVAALPWGGFVVAWADSPDPGQPSGDDGIRAQVFDATGAAIGDQLFVNVTTASTQLHPSVVVLESGDIVIGWSDESGTGGDTSGFAVRARIFSISEPSGPTPGADTLNGTPNADVIDGLAGNDVIHGLGDNDQLYGGADNDQLFGDEGNDTLFGGTGNDVMSGGLGNDVYHVDSAADVVSEAASQGRDVVYTGVNFTLSSGSEVEVLSAASQGATTPLELIGNGFANEIYGNAGANFLDGGGGADYLAGFAGSDTYIVDNANDVISEAVGGGRDVVYAFVNYTLTSGQEIEVLSTISQAATTPLELTGNQFRQEMYGNDGANFIDGGVGDEDYMRGFGGNDTYIVDHGSDYVAEFAGGGRDVVYAKVSYTLTPDSEVEVLSVISQGAGVAIDLTGNALVQEMYGNTDANFLDGGGGADYMQGFAGNDSYVVEVQGDVVVEAAGEGRDVVYARASYVLAAGQSIEVLSAQSQGSTAALDLTGNELANELYGSAGANVLNGGLGADYLQGFGGADSFAFTTALGNGNVDQLADFLAGTDKLALDDAIFAGIGTPGAFNAAAFVVGAQAADADDRIVYNAATGQLFYDADGNGAGAQVLFATLSGNPALTASDFTVI